MSGDQNKNVSSVNRTHENQYKTVLPDEIVKNLGLEPGQNVGVIPECEDSLEVRIETDVTGEKSNQRKLTGEGREMGQTVLRFPTSLAEPLGLDEKEIEWRIEDDDIVGKVVESGLGMEVED